MNRIKELRQLKGWSQQDLGNYLNVQKSAISKYENGKISLTGETIEKLVELFDVTSDILLGIENNVPILESSIKSSSFDYTDSKYPPNVSQFISIGEKIRIILTHEGIRQKDLAKELNISPSTLNGYITGYRMPDIHTLNRIANVLGYPTSYFLNSKEDLNKKFDNEVRQDIVKDIQEIIAKIDSDKEGLLYYNNQKISDQTKELFRDALEFALKIVKTENKQKYTQKKYRK